MKRTSKLHQAIDTLTALLTKQWGMTPTVVLEGTGAKIFYPGLDKYPEYTIEKSGVVRMDPLAGYPPK